MSNFFLPFLFAGIFLFLSNHSCSGEEVTIEEMQKQLSAITQVVLELRNKVIALEEEINKINKQKSLGNASVQEIPTPQIQNGWRALKRGLSLDQVRVILGEPVRVLGGEITIWSYKNNGSVTFYKDKVSGWSEPQ